MLEYYQTCTPALRLRSADYAPLHDRILEEFRQIYVRGLGRYPMAIMIVGAMIAGEPAFELGVAILTPHCVDLLHVRGIDGELDL